MRSRLEPGKLLPTMLLLLMVGSLARSIEQARWTEGLHVLVPISFLGVITGALLASSRLRPFKAHLLGVFSGFIIVIWQTGRVLSAYEAASASRFTIVWTRFREWITVVLHGGSSYDQLLFVFIMGSIIWFLAYNSSWFMLRYAWAWWAVLPIGLVMLVNIGYALRPDYRPFVVFLLASMLLLVQSHLMRSSERWRQDGLGHEAGLATKFLLLGGVVSLLLLTLAWQGPSRSLAVTAKAAFERLETPWESVHDRWRHAFAFLYPGSAPRTTTTLGGGFTNFSDSFELGGPLRMGNQNVFTARAEPGQYWRGVALGTYTGAGWQTAGSKDAAVSSIYQESRSLQGPQRTARLKPGVEKSDQQVTVLLPVGRSLFASDTPVSVDRTARWQIPLLTRRAQAPVRGALSSQQTAARGSELARLRKLLVAIGPEHVARASVRGIRLRATPPLTRPSSKKVRPVSTAAAHERQSRARQLVISLRAELSALQQNGISARYTYAARRAPVISYSYLAPNQREVLDVTSVAPLTRGSVYKIRSIVANPTDAQLDKATGEIPDWVSERYLQVPPSVPPRVRKLALQITAGASTPHQKARAIESYLRKKKYREDMPVTPPGRDFVDYFLFDLKEGYCTYYSSAMAIMLREIGLPTRVVTGFAPGKFDNHIQQYVVSESQAHMWPQVYQPGYGWITYEPTPIRSLVERTPDVAAPKNPGVGAGIDPNSTQIEKLFGKRRTDGTAATGSPGLPLPVRFGLTLLAALAGALAVVYAMSLLRLRGLRGATRQYAKLVQVGTALGIGIRVTQTPTEYGARLASEVPGADTSVRRITSQYVAEVFGRQHVEASDLEGEWKRVVSQAMRSMPGRIWDGVRALAWRAARRGRRPG